MNARTWSLAAGGDDMPTSRGTAWVINKVSDGDEYEYYLGTNWHVINYEGAEYTNFTYWDDEQGTIGTMSNYQAFASATLIPWENFTYDGSSKTQAIDFRVLRVDFGELITVPTKNKLDKLNEYYNTHNHHINTFVCDYTETTDSRRKFILGYPVNYVTGKEYHVLSDSGSFPDDPLFYHACGDAGIVDVSPQYEFLPAQSSTWMVGGASGSMILDSDFSICGIYWGWWRVTGTDICYPFASIFNSSIKNFVAAYQ